MTTLDDRPPEGTPAPLVSRHEALMMMGKGWTSAALLARAATPALIASLAVRSGATRKHVRDLFLAFSAAVGGLEAEGMTFAGCWDELGWTAEYVAVHVLAIGPAVPRPRTAPAGAPALRSA